MTSNGTATPEDANTTCVGPTATTAGKAPSCEGCPNQSSCASGETKSQISANARQHALIRQNLSCFNQIILVLSGKGGVGKSTVCCQVAHTLAARGYGVGVLDLDLCGPSTARMLGVSGREVHRSGSGWTPVYANENLAVMSLSFLLQGEDMAVVWRGPRKNGMIGQFLTETNWTDGDEDGGLDYLLIDTPPGTSDEHISIVQFLQGACGLESGSGSASGPNLGGALVVTTPEEVAMADVRKELNFCAKTKLPVIGIVENMSSFQTRIQDLTFLKPPSNDDDDDDDDGAMDEDNNNNTLSVNKSPRDCTQHVLNTLREKCPELLDVIASANVFPPSGNGPSGMAASFGVPYFGGIPLDPNLLKSCEEGISFVMNFPDSAAVKNLNAIVDKVVMALPIDDDVDDHMISE